MIKTETAVQVSLKIEAMIDGEFERFTFQEAGCLVSLNDYQHYLTYTEHQAGQATPVRMRLDAGALSVTRNGARRTRLQFNPQEPTLSHYRTEYGVLSLQVETAEAVSEMDWAAAQGHLRLRYRLRNESGLIGNYYLDLSFER